jgi:hypothetical protein
VNKKDLNLMCLLKNVREVKLNDCKGLNNLTPWAKNLTKLKMFEMKNCHSSDFLIQLFQSSSNTLTKLVIIGITIGQDLIQQIPLYLYSLIHLEIPTINPTELISIFNSCSQLVYLSNVALSDDRDLNSLGGFIPKKLRRIDFILENKIDFEESLRCFSEEYHANNSGLLKCLKFKYSNGFWSRYRLDSVQSGIQIIEWSD